MRVLVTGATGFIGRHVARTFAARGAEVFALARAPADRIDLPGVTAIEGDLADRDSLSALEGLADLDIVCHLAADTRMDASDEEIEAANVTGTENLLAALGERARGTRFLFASSIAAVDRAGRPTRPLDDQSPPRPRSAYAKSKLRCEEILAADGETRDFALTCLRLGTVYGPGAEKGGVVDLAKAARESGIAARLRWPGRISFVFVEDVAEVFHRLAVIDDPVVGTYFLAEDRGWSMAEAAEILREVQKSGKGFLPFPRVLLRFMGWFLYLPVIRNVAPWSLRCALADTILCDSGPLAHWLEMTWTPLPEGLERTFG